MREAWSASLLTLACGVQAPVPVDDEGNSTTNPSGDEVGDGESLLECNGDSCCSPWCNLEAPECPMPLECTPWFEEGTAPPGLEHIGVCASI